MITTAPNVENQHAELGQQEGEPLNIFAFASLGGGAAARYDYVMNTSLFDQVRQLSVEEQIELVEALWDNIVA